VREALISALRRILLIIRSPHFWVLVAMFAIGAVLHYPEEFHIPSLFPSIGLSRHAIERILFLLPIAYAAYIAGTQGWIASSIAALAIMMPRVFLVSPSEHDALIETCAVIMVGGIVNLWFTIYRREKNRSEQALASLAAAQKELQSYVQLLSENDRRLSALNEVSDVVSRSLEMEDILSAAAEKVAEVMDVDVVLTFLLDEDKQELKPTVYRGVSDEFITELGTLKVGEGFNGLVAETGRPLVVEDAPSDSRLTKEVVLKEGIQTVLSVPLRGAGKITGTLSVGTRAPREFNQEEIELLSHIANHIGVAVDNARLYRSQLMMAQQIARDASTEKQMRESLTYYLQQAIRSQEEERRRIARELHDETAQDLAALSRQIDTITSKGARLLSSKDVALLEELHQQADRALEGVRRFSQDLRPSILDDLGLVPALEWLASDLEQHFRIKVNFEVKGQVNRFAPEVELVLFRIAQEALRNIWKHSGASQAWIGLECLDGNTVLTIGDNGKGFKTPEKVAELAPAGKLGLVGMQERARLVGAHLTVMSEPSEGTIITVELPTNIVNVSS
jgi:two-component system sensor histidine kinase DegS